MAALLSIKEDNVFASFGAGGGLVFLIIQVLLFWLVLRYVVPSLYLLIGRIWAGKATLPQMIMVMSLALIPEVIYLMYTLLMLAASGEVVEVNYLVRLVGWVFTIRILVIGFSRIQGFSYVFALMNLFLPGIILVVLGILLGGLFS